MKQIILLIGIMMALVVCITPVAAVSGDDFEIVIDDSGDIPAYKYLNNNYKVHPDCPNSPGEKYFKIFTRGTLISYSIVTFKPANIPDAPRMIVDTSGKRNIYLPYHSVDEWEIEFYCNDGSHPLYRCKAYEMGAGTVNVKEVFGEYLPRGLDLVLSWAQILCTHNCQYNDESYVVKPAWSIPKE